MTDPTPAARIAAARDALLDARRDLTAALRTDRSRARGPLVRMLHEVEGMLSPGDRYASQAGQDRVVDRIFGGRRGGTFLDIGAYDGVTGSNTLYFEKYRGWTGVLVEPVKRHRDVAEMWRDSPCLPYAVAATDGVAAFIAVTAGLTQMSGLADAYDDALLRRVRSDPRHGEEQISVQTRSLNAIFAESGMAAVDFVSLDIEGGELAALEAFDHAAHPVAVWAIENNTAAPQIPALMRDRGYRLAEFCGVDDIYVRQDP